MYMRAGAYPGIAAAAGIRTMRTREGERAWAWACVVLAVTTGAEGASADCGHCADWGVRPPVVASAAANIRVLVPTITSLPQFVNCSDPANVTGFCVDVFEQALLSIPALRHSTLNYTCYDLSTGTTMTTYDDMVQQLQHGIYDIVVGDVTISAKRFTMADFTQPFLPSGIVIVSRVLSTSSSSSSWLLFAAPFTLRMWYAIAGAFLFVGLFMAIMEYNIGPKHDDEHQEVSVICRIKHTSRVVVEALLLLQRDEIRTSVARMTMVAWLLFVLLLGQSYSAGLNSFLTATNLAPVVTDLISLKASGREVGVWKSSIVKDYLVQRFRFDKASFRSFDSSASYRGNLTHSLADGGVEAIVDELPYVEVMLHSLSGSACDFHVSPPLTNEGFGLAIRKDFQGVSDKFSTAAILSMAILNITSCGCLQELQERSNLTASYHDQCSNDSYLTQITRENVLVLFVLLLGISMLCIIKDNIEALCLKSREVARMVSTRIKPSFRQVYSRDSFRIRGSIETLQSEHFL